MNLSEIIPGALIISENYQWDEQSNEFIHLPTKKRFSANLYEKKVDVYEDRVKSWFLNVAQRLVEKPDDFQLYASLSIVLAYIEGVEQYRQGKKTPRNKSGEWFKTSAQRVIPTASPEAINRLWKEARCGLFHTGFTDGTTYLAVHYHTALEIKDGHLQINPIRFVQAAFGDLDAYLNDLRSFPNSDLSKRFLKLWDHRWENS